MCSLQVDMQENRKWLGKNPVEFHKKRIAKLMNMLSFFLC